MKIPPRWLGQVVIGICSLVTAFFVVFNVLFSDAASFTERALAVLTVGGMYFILSFAMHWIWSIPGRAWRLWLVIPGGVAGLYATFSDYTTDQLLYPMLVLMSMVVGIWGGWYICRRRISLPGIPFGKL